METSTGQKKLILGSLSVITDERVV